MKDLLYIIGKGSKYNNEELKYSLRSIEKNCTGYDRIFIVGYKPTFLNDNVIYVPCEDKYDGYKHRNILNCIKTVIDTTDISNEFVLQSDDHFYIKPYNFDDITIYLKKAELNNSTVGGKYKKALFATRKLLEKYNLPITNTAQHCGTLFNKEIFKSIEDTLVKEAIEDQWGAEPTCLIQAVMQKELGMVPVPRKDCKIKHQRTRLEIEKKIGDNFCFSTSDEAFAYVKPYLNKLFPNPSKYEK